MGEEAGTTATTARRRALEAAGLVHPNPAGVTAALFDGTRPFFLAADKVQVIWPHPSRVIRAAKPGGRNGVVALCQDELQPARPRPL